MVTVMAVEEQLDTELELFRNKPGKVKIFLFFACTIFQDTIHSYKSPL